MKVQRYVKFGGYANDFQSINSVKVDKVHTVPGTKLLPIPGLFLIALGQVQFINDTNCEANGGTGF